MKILILAGGGGTRLWPLSRQTWPKQFLNLSGNPQGASLLLETIHRCLSETTQPNDTYIVTGESLLPQVNQELLNAQFPEMLGNVICEPFRRNTAPAIGLAAQYIWETSGADLEEVIVILPADHAVTDIASFQADLLEAERLARAGYIVTLGIPPTRPETGFGYIETAGSLSDKAWAPVRRFVEKPDYETACQYVDSGKYLWNAGIFILSIKTLVAAFEAYTPELATLLQGGYQHALENFQHMPNISIDYAVMEKAQQMAVIPLKSNWSDLGSWDNVYDNLAKDTQGNAVYGTSPQLINTQDSLIWSETGRFVATIGLKDCLIIDTPDALLISKRGDSQSVRDIVEALAEETSPLLATSPIQYEGWGTLQCLTEASVEDMEPKGASVYQLTLMPWQEVEVATQTRARWSVISGEGERQEESETRRLISLESWIQEAGSTTFLQTQEHELTLTCISTMPPNIKKISNSREVAMAR